MCPSGEVELSLICLQHHFRTVPKPPRFPVLLHETFTASGFYREDFMLREHFERTLSRERLECSFWQNGRRLAHFKGALHNLLDLNSVSVRSMRSTENGFPCNLILKPSTCFPGIIGPKCVMRVELDVAELHHVSASAYPSSVSIASLADWRPLRSHSCLSSGNCCDVSTNTASCTATAASNQKKCRRLQKPVCHVRQRSARFVSTTANNTV